MTTQPHRPRQAVLERLWARNAIRRELGLRPINISKVYEQKVTGRSQMKAGFIPHERKDRQR